MTAHAPETTAALPVYLTRMERNHSLRLSPNGRLVAFVATTDVGDELRLWDGGGERMLATHRGKMVCDLGWTADSAVVLYRYAEHGREAWRLAGVRVPERVPVPIPHQGSVSEYWLAETEPSALAFAARVSTSRLASLYRADLGVQLCEPTLAAANPGFHRWLLDARLRPRGGIRLGMDGTADVLFGDDPMTAAVVHHEDADSLADFSVLRFSRDGTRLYVISSMGASTRRLLALTADGTATTLFEHPALDLESYPVAPGGVWFSPVTGEPDLCAVMDQRLRYHFLTPSTRVAGYLASTPRDSRVVIDRAADDKVWLVTEVHDDGPLRQQRYHLADGRSEHIMVNRPELADARLSRLEDFCFQASDGHPISGYAMRPLDAEPPYPTVLLIHGGPAGRDTWRFNADAQYFATLGWLSLHINFRGSRGYGARFRRASNGDWGGRAQQDLYDAVAHGVAAGLVDADQVALMGASYGGYAALLAACTRPDLACCAVAISPLCDLVSFAAAPPAYWNPLAGSLIRQITRRADSSEVGAADLTQRSPAQVLSPRCAPLLIAHGERDPRVPVASVDAFVTRATGLGVPVRYLRFCDEGHHVKSNPNRQTLFSEIRAFLEQHHAADR